MNPVGIIGAMDEEIIPLIETIHIYKTEQKANLTFNIGDQNGIPVIIVKSGVGKVNAAICSQILISEYMVSKIINTGIAGGTDQRLDLFDFVISNEALQHDVDVTAFGYPPGIIPGIQPSIFTVELSLITLAQKAHTDNTFNNRLFCGRIASGDTFITDNEQRKKICDFFHPLCVEMEGAAIAQVCTLNSIPFIIVRCISDLADKKTEAGFEEKAGKLCSKLVLNMISLIDS